jgi:hypothetical protein
MDWTGNRSFLKIRLACICPVYCEEYYYPDHIISKWVYFVQCIAEEYYYPDHILTEFNFAKMRVARMSTDFYSVKKLFLQKSNKVVLLCYFFYC